MVDPTQQSRDEFWMRRAIQLGQQAALEGEVPVGAVLVQDDQMIAEGWNQPIAGRDPTSHAEIVTLRSAGQILHNYRMPGTTLYVTLEPCPMCAGALVHARVARVVYGASDPKTGAAGSVFDTLISELHNHKTDVLGGVLEQECGDMLRGFFRARR